MFLKFSAESVRFYLLSQVIYKHYVYTLKKLNLSKLNFCFWRIYFEYHFLPHFPTIYNQI